MKFAPEDLHPTFEQASRFGLMKNMLSRSETFTPEK